MRLDLFLLKKGLVTSRNQAQTLIRSGKVWVDEMVVDKPSTKVKGNPSLRLEDGSLSYVSRGGIKLQAAIEHFHLNCQDKIFAGMGASTGGFTDCLLQYGASKIYAIDVGSNQLAPKLRQDPRVVVMEGCNIRHIQQLPEKMDALVGDLSFISLTKVIPAMKRIICSKGEGILLIKPQFEVGPGKTKGGLVRDSTLRETAIQEVCHALERDNIQIMGRIPSPLTGAKKGNLEELIHIRFPK